MNLLILLAILPALLHADELPFCRPDCTCISINKTDSAKVTCTKDIKQQIFADSTWKNEETNETYPYSELTLKNQKFIDLNFTFPPSDIIYLNLANNDIYTIQARVFKNLQKMKVLILSNNDLSFLDPKAFEGLYLPERYEPLKNLIELRLDHNQLHSLNQDIFEHTTDLEILDLSHNPLMAIDHHTLLAIDSLVHLRELYLGYTNITTLPALILHTPLYLSILDLSGNPIDTIPSTLSDSHNLTVLHLNDTAFVNLTKENGFPDIPTLKTLYFSRCLYLERIEEGALAGLTKLEELYLRDNTELGYVDGFALPKMDHKIGGSIWPPIKKLFIGNNKLAYLDSDFLARWDALTELDIRANPWTCECENQWMVDLLIPMYLKIDAIEAPQVRCAAPVEMRDYTFMDLWSKKYQMRCLDLYGAKPENDGAILIGVLAGVLLAIPIILFGIYAYQRRWFGFVGFCDNNPASYSRRFYSTTARDEYL